MEHIVSLQRRWGDLDSNRHINNVTYLRYAEEARVRWWTEMSLDTGARLPVVVARQDIVYRRPLGFGLEPLEVHQHITHIGSSSFTVTFRILDGQDVVAHGNTVVVVFDLQAGSPVRIPEQLRMILTGYLDTEAPG